MRPANNPEAAGLVGIHRPLQGAIVLHADLVKHMQGSPGRYAFAALSVRLWGAIANHWDEFCPSDKLAGGYTNALGLQGRRGQALTVDPRVLRHSAFVEAYYDFLSGTGLAQRDAYPPVAPDFFDKI